MMLTTLQHCRRRHVHLLSVKSVVNVILVLLFCSFDKTSSLYSNHFALHIPTGSQRAEEIAQKHGFVNLGQVS